MQRAANHICLREWLTRSVGEEKARLTNSHELSEQISKRAANVNLSVCLFGFWFLSVRFPARLLDCNRAAVRREMAHFQPKGFANSESGPSQKCVQHLILAVRLFNDGTHSFFVKDRLFLIFDERNVEEFILPLARKQFFAVVVEGRGY